MTPFKNCYAELRAEECGRRFWGSSDNNLVAFSHQADPYNPEFRLHPRMGQREDEDR